jgi:serine O-acetyltransferase
VTLGNRYLDRPSEAPVLGQRVNVGAGAKLLGSITIGNDVNIGANAVVLCDVPDGKTALGIPAKVVEPKEKGGVPSSAVDDLAVVMGVLE